MAKKKVAADARASEASRAKGARVIALQSYTDEKSGEFHPYGHEFEHPKGAKLDALIEKKVLRIDDRGAPPAPVVLSPEPAKPNAGA